jgi:hypothetical protein
LNDWKEPRLVGARDFEAIVRRREHRRQREELERRLQAEERLPSPPFSRSSIARRVFLGTLAILVGIHVGVIVTILSFFVFVRILHLEL